MKLSKKTFFCAALLLSGACSIAATAATERVSDGTTEVTMTGNTSSDKNYLITSTGTLIIDTDGRSYTFSGELLGGGVSYNDESQSVVGDYADATGNGTGGTVTITGGGTLTYDGFKDISYYSSTYTFTDGNGVEEAGLWNSSLIGVTADGELGSYDWTSTAFSGTLTIEGGTTLEVGGYLTQYVRYYDSITSNGIGGGQGAFVGVQRIYLNDDSKISFANATKNLENADFDVSDWIAESSSGEPTTVLRYLLDVTASMNSTIELGLDADSTVRLVIHTRAEINDASVGILSGTGRLYFSGDTDSGNNPQTSIAILNQATFSTLNGNSSNTSTTTDLTSLEGILSYTTWLNETHDFAGEKYDEENDTYSAYNIADVFVSGVNLKLGSADGSTVVNNVLATATAIQLQVAGGYTAYSSGGSTVETIPVYSNLNGSDASYLTIYGVQVLNNLQSLFAERVCYDGLDGYTELYHYYENPLNTSYPIRGAASSVILMAEGSTTIVNQTEDRDGFYYGSFCAAEDLVYTTEGNTTTAHAPDTANDSIIVKTGSGTFANISPSHKEHDSSQLINRLYILEGKWIASVDKLGSGRILVEGGELWILATDEVVTCEARLEGVSNLVIAQSSIYYTDEEDEDGNITTVQHGGLLNDGREYYVTSSAIYTYNGELDSDTLYFGPAQVKFTQAQNAYYGDVTVNSGITLLLGNSEDWGNSSIFSNANSMTLAGTGNNTGQMAELSISSYQIIVNLSGEAGKSRVSLTDYSTLVLVTSDSAYDYRGNLEGSGGVVKYGNEALTLGSSGSSSSYYGETVVMDGSLALGKENAIISSSGLVLGSNTSVVNSGNTTTQTFSALIGESGSTVEMGTGDLVIGYGYTDNQLTNIWNSLDGNEAVVRYYFVTYNGAHYMELLGLTDGSNGAGLSDDLQGLFNGRVLGSERPDSTITVVDTNEYLEDPGHIKEAFTCIYATIDAETFDTIAATSKWNAIFGSTGATNLVELLDTVLDYETIYSYVQTEKAKIQDSGSSAWTERQLDYLLELAEEIKDKGAAGFLEAEGDGTYNLTADLWQELVDSCFLTYLEEEYGVDSALADSWSSLYDFIVYFDEDYSFRLTTANINILSDRYGFFSTAWSIDSLYESFDEAIGIYTSSDYGPSYDGVISGSGVLEKRGTESLILTGVNTYTGATLVKAGELRIDHDAISRSEYIEVYEGALLTIVADSTDEDQSFVLNSRRDGDGQIIGAGTILIDADSSSARLVIEKALAHDDAFTGNIIVGMGTLVVNIEEREVFSPDIYINADAAFEFDFQNEDSDLVLTGSILGQGTFIKSGEGKLTFDDGDAFANVDNNAVSLEIDGGEIQFNLDGIIDATGASQTSFRDSDTTIIVTSGTTLTFNIAENVSYQMAAQIEGMGSFIKDGAGSLTLNRTDGQDSIWQLDTFSILNGSVTIATGAPYAFVHIYAAPTEEITDDDGNVIETIETALVVNGDLTVSDGEIYGSISGSGYITKTSFSEIMLLAGIDDEDGEPDDGDPDSDGDPGGGDDTVLLIAGDISGFTGDFYIESGTLQIDSDTDQDVYAAIYGNRDVVIKDSPDDTDPIVIEGETTKLVKSGSGSVAFYGNEEDECLDLLKVDVVVEGGKLTLDGAKFATEVVEEMDPCTDDTTNVTHFLPSASIAADSTLEILFDDVSPAEDEEYWDLATIELSGEGTFEIGSGSVKLSTRDNSQDFTGTFYIDEGAELLLGETIDSLSGIGGEGTLAIADSVEEFTFNVESDSTFTGTLEAKNSSTTLTIVGEGRLSLADSSTTATLDNITAVHVGKDGDAGHIGFASNQKIENLTIDVSGSSVALTDNVDNSRRTMAALTTVTLADGVTDIGLLANGTIKFSESDDHLLETIFNLKDESGATPTVDITLSNLADGTLTINGVSNIADNVTLATSGSGTLAISATDDETYAGSIYGSGNLQKVAAGTLTLTASSHSYEGTTTVSKGTLAFKTDSGYGSVAIDSSEIIVASGATLSGGVSLTADDANVTFENGSTYLVDVTRGESLSYTGTVSGAVDIVVDATSRARGTAYSVIRYTGDGEGSLDDLTINSISALDAPVFVDNTDNGNVVIYVATDNLSSISGADFHDGLNSILKTLSKWACPDENGNLNGTDEQNAIGTALIKTSTHSLSKVVNNLSPLGLGSTITMVHAGLNSDVNTIEGRLEQRLYDNMSPNSIWMYSEDWEFFAQAQGSYISNDDDNDTMTYDYYTYGVLAGMDKKFSLENTLGFALSYDHGKADIHHSGGKVESDAIRVILFGGSLLNEFISLNYGAEVGYAYYDVKRKTIMGRNKGDTDGLFGGVFLDFVGAFELMQTLDGARVDLLPHIGVTVSYYNVDSYNESGSISALDVDSFDALSVRGRVGAQINWMVPVGEGFGNDGSVRASFDLSFVHEFCDDDTDIDAKMLGENASATAQIFSENAFTLTPSIAYDFNGHTSVFLSYEFLISTDSEVANTVHLGFRHRF